MALKPILPRPKTGGAVVKYAIVINKTQENPNPTTARFQRFTRKKAIAAPSIPAKIMIPTAAIGLE